MKVLPTTKFHSVGNPDRERLINLTNRFTELVREYKHLIKKFDALKKKSKDIMAK